MSEKRLTVGMRCPKMVSSDYDEDRHGGYRFQEDVFNELSVLFGTCEKEVEFEIEANGVIVHAHVDILCKTEGGWAVFEVKSGKFDPMHIWQVSAYRYIAERALGAHVDAAIIYPTHMLTDSLHLSRVLSQILPVYYIPHLFNEGKKYVAVSTLRWRYGNENMGPWCMYCKNVGCKLGRAFRRTLAVLEVRRAEKRGEESEDTGAKTL